MLRELRIRNYALIEGLELDLPGGFVAFTGETGAGKSIVIGALALVLGGKSRSEHLRSGAGEVVVEARFGGPFGKGVRAVLEAAGLEVGDEILLRRVVPSSGKSRAYAGDAAVALQTMESLGRVLVDIHGQHQHQSLLRPETHLDFLDGFGQLTKRRERVGELYRRRAALLQERGGLRAREAEKLRRLDFLSFQREEIEKAELRPGEEEELAARREVLRHTERLAAGAGESEELIYSGEHPAAEAVHRAARRLEELTEVDPKLGDLVRALGECQLQLEELGREVQAYHRRLAADPEELEQVEERLARVRNLKRKYGASVGEVLERLGEIRAEIEGIESGGERLAEIDSELPGLERELADDAGKLSLLREKCRRDLEGRVLAELAGLNMAGASFEVSLSMEDDAEGGLEISGRRVRLDERGADRAEFLVSANPGEPLKPLARVASGGEISRIMLAVKTVLAGVDRIPTLVFDEVDIGIGGRTARMVGDRLRGVARGRQVLCVTHLPQIASLADSHYNVSKSLRRGRTVVAVRRLEGEERIDEIARMLGGRDVTKTTRRHAEEMLAQPR